MSKKGYADNHLLCQLFTRSLAACRLACRLFCASHVECRREWFENKNTCHDARACNELDESDRAPQVEFARAAATVAMVPALRLDSVFPFICENTLRVVRLPQAYPR